MLNIQLQDDMNFIDNKKQKTISKMLQYIYETELKKGDYFFELIIVDKQEIQRINKEYRSKNTVTDVISFSMWDSQSSIKTPLIGEIFLCKDKVIEQAKEFNHSCERELFFLISHGIYHLLGYDHQTIEQEKEMMNKQYNVLEYLKIGR